MTLSDVVMFSYFSCYKDCDSRLIFEEVVFDFPALAH